MKHDYSIHDALYLEARAKGWSGWGGNERIVKVGELIPRLLAHHSVPASGNLLELGCGEGTLSRLLALHGYQVTGVDVSETAINWAREKPVGSALSVKFIAADLTQKDLQLPGYYSLIVDGNCLHCIMASDRPVFLENIQRHLNPQGVFFVSSLCAKGKENELLWRNGQPYRYVPSVDNLLVELGDAGFVVLNTVVHERSEYDHVNIHAQKHCAT